jgi:hypothetical protein
LFDFHEKSVFHVVVLILLDLSFLLPGPNFVPALSASPIFLARVGAGSVFGPCAGAHLHFLISFSPSPGFSFPPYSGAEASFIPISACVVFDSAAAVQYSFCHRPKFLFLPLSLSFRVVIFCTDLPLGILVRVPKLSSFSLTRSKLLPPVFGTAVRFAPRSMPVT